MWCSASPIGTPLGSDANRPTVCELRRARKTAIEKTPYSGIVRGRRAGCPHATRPGPTDGRPSTGGKKITCFSSADDGRVAVMRSTTRHRPPGPGPRDYYFRDPNTARTRRSYRVNFFRSPTPTDRGPHAGHAPRLADRGDPEPGRRGFSPRHTARTSLRVPRARLTRRPSPGPRARAGRPLIAA